MSLLHEWLKKAARDRGGATALVYRDTYVSWRGLLHRIERRAQELKSFGIGPGAALGIMLGNVPELVILALAAVRLRAPFVPIDPTTGTRDLDMLLDVLPLKGLVTRPHGDVSPVPGANPVGARAPTRPPGPKPRHTPELRRRLQGTLLHVNVFRPEKSALPDDTEATAVLFTAESGGDPKGVLRTDRELESVARFMSEAIEIQPTDQVLAATPFHQGFGFDAGLLTALSSGATLHLEDEASEKRLGKALRDLAIDVLVAGPAVYGQLARVPAAKPLKRKGQRFLSSGSALPPSVAEAFATRYKVRPLSLYHATEAGPMTLDRAGKDPATVGKPLPGVEIRIGAPNGPAVHTVEPGPVWVRSPAVAQTFVPPLPASLKAASAPVGRTTPEGWLRTGDLGSLDKGGRLTLKGREDDLVKVDGKRVALGEVAGCLETFAKVKAAEARVILDDFGGPMVVARVVSAGACRAEELIDHCARSLAPYKVPRQIEFCETLG